MYNLPYYKASSEEDVLAFMQAHPFALLCGCDQLGHPVATQVPMMFDRRDDHLVLRGHIMKQTDHHKAFLQNPQALAVFTGPHTYVSARWYSDPQQGSTWNYLSVHARGRVNFMDEPELRELLRATTAHFENNPDSPASFHHLPEEYVDRMVKAIVGFELKVERIDHVFKLSQNRDAASFAHIVEQLGQSDDSQAREVADYMTRYSGPSAT